MDRFYTPSGLAALLVGSAKARKAGLVADFAAGDGALLRAAKDRWPAARLFGSDVDPDALRVVETLPSAPGTALHDFLTNDAPPEALSEIRGCCDVVLLNPPFTCRGNRLYSVSLRNRLLRGSKALAFVARSLEFLASSGEALAIVPASCLTSARDAELLNALRTDYDVHQIGEINRNAFPGCSVSVVIIRVRSRSKRFPLPRAEPAKPVLMKSYGAEIMRGSLPVGDARSRPGGMPCIHTTDLRGGRLLKSTLSVALSSRVEGRVVLLPRVGQPSASKLVLATVEEAILSDCVFALRSNPPGQEDQLLRLLNSNWAQLKGAYGGSCAPYLTRDRLQSLLLSWGVASTVVTAMHRTADGALSKTGGHGDARTVSSKPPLVEGRPAIRPKRENFG